MCHEAKKRKKVNKVGRINYLHAKELTNETGHCSINHGKYIPIIVQCVSW